MNESRDRAQAKSKQSKDPELIERHKEAISRDKLSDVEESESISESETERQPIDPLAPDGAVDKQRYDRDDAGPT